MAVSFWKFRLSWGKGLELLWKNPVFITQLEAVHAVFFSNSSLDNGESGQYKIPMWKRIKKNDPEMDHFLVATDTKNRINDISKVMECTIGDATELVKRDSPVAVTDSDKLHEKMKLLMSYKFSSQDVIANPAILHRTYNVLQYRLKTLKILKCPADKLSLSILKKSNTAFKAYVRKCLEEDQFLSLFSSHQNCLTILLDCDPEKAKELIDKYNLMSVSPILLKNKIDILKHFQISSDFIQDNVKVLLTASALVLKNRLQVLKDDNLLNCPDIKLGSMLLSKHTNFEKSFAYLKKNYTALEGCRNKEEYLIFRLKCSAKVAESLVTRKPISCMSEVKLQKMLDFFLSEMEVSCDFVISNVFLMGYSGERMQRRWPVICASPYANTKMIPRLLSMSDDSFEKSLKDAETV